MTGSGKLNVAVTKIIAIKTVMGIKPVLFAVLILSNRQNFS
jgi:hypothetical protein